MTNKVESFGGVFFGAIACFALAFVLSVILPVLALDKIQEEFRTIEQLAENVSDEFKAMAKEHPESFKEAFGEPNKKSYAEALRLGRDIYIAEGCWHCHSQYIRPVAKEVQRWGKVSNAAEYNNALSRPQLWGTRRVGPDLTREGGVHSNDWHFAHLWEPPATTPGSVMPRYRWLFKADGRPAKRAFSVVAYLQWLGKERIYLDALAAKKAAALKKSKGASK